MAKNESKTQGTGSANPFLNSAAPHMQPPANVDRASLEKQEAAVTPKPTAAVQEAIEANPKNSAREVVHPEFKKLGLTVYIVNSVEHKARVKDMDVHERLTELFPDMKFVRDTVKGGKVFVYDPIALLNLIAAQPKKARATAGSSIKYHIESSESLGYDGQHYIVCDSIENTVKGDSVTRQFVGVKLHGTYSAANREGHFTLIRDNKEMRVSMIVKRALDAYPDNYVDGKPKADVKVSPDRLVFIMTARVTDKDGKEQLVVCRSYGQTNTLNSFMKLYDRIIFPAPTATPAE